MSRSAMSNAVPFLGNSEASPPSEAESPVRREASTTSSVFRCLFPVTSEESQSQDDSPEAKAEAEADAETREPVSSMVTPVTRSTLAAEDETREGVSSPSTPTTTSPANTNRNGDLSDTTSESQSQSQERQSPMSPAPSQPTVTTPSTDDSQPQDIGDVTEDPDIMEHDEYKELVVAKSESRRIVRYTSRPTLWRHQRRPMASLCVYDAVDDGVCLAETGLIWSIDGTPYEIVLVSSLGWGEQRSRRSHQVTYRSPIYIIFRGSQLQGTAVQFEHLYRLIASSFFREGRPHGTVNFSIVTNARQLSKSFVQSNQHKDSEWSKIKYLRTQAEQAQIEKEKKEIAKRQREKKRKIALARKMREESARKKRELEELKRKEHKARQVAEAAARKAAKAETQRRNRHVQRLVKTAVTNACKKLENTLQEEFAKSIETSRSEIEGDLGHRITQCEEALEAMPNKEDLEKMMENFEKLIEEFERYKTLVDKRFKTISKKMKSIRVNEAARSNEENEAPPLKRSKSTAMMSTASPSPRTLRMSARAPNDHLQPSVSPPLSVVNMNGDTNWGWGMNVVQMPRPPTPWTNGSSRYISPVFSQRNYANTKFL